MESDGPNQFQSRCISVCHDALKAVGIDPPAFAREPGPYGFFYTLTVTIAGHNLSVFIYQDGAEFSADDDVVDCRFEKWDYKSSDELVAAFGSQLREELPKLLAAPR